MLRPKDKVKTLLGLYKDRDLDIQIAKIMGWHYLTDEKQELADWVGVSPLDAVDCVPFYSSDYEQAQKFVEFVKTKYWDLKLEFNESYDHKQKLYYCQFEYTTRSGHKRSAYVSGKDESFILVTATLLFWKQMND
jgi:hypothetical protein